MTIKLDKRIETAFKKGFYTKRKGKIEFINPKRKRMIFQVMDLILMSLPFVVVQDVVFIV